MERYGMDYGRWGGSDRYDGEWGGYGAGGRGGHGGGMRPEGWGPDWRDFPGEEGWFGGGPQGHRGGGGYDMQMGGGMGRGFGGGYDAGYGRGMGMGMGGYGGGYGRGGMGGYDRMMRGGGYGMGYGGRDMGMGGYDMEMGRGGMGGRGMMGTSESSIGERGGGEGRMRAADIMTENPEAVTPDTTLEAVARRMRELDVGIIPVVDDASSRRLRGVITDRDIAVRAVAEGKDGRVKVSECMTTSVETVNKNDSMRDVMELMKREQVRRVPVTDREGRLVGIIAQADLALDYAGDRPQRERMVEDTLERISEPTRGARAGAGRGRMEQESGGMRAQGGGQEGRGGQARQQGGTSGRAAGNTQQGREDTGAS